MAEKELKENPVEELKKQAEEQAKKTGATPEDVFIEIASGYLQKYQPDLVEAIGRGAAKVGDTGMIAASSLPGTGKAILTAIGGAGRGFTEAMNAREKRDAELMAAMAKFKPAFTDPYAERKDKEMKIKILDKVSDRANDYEKSETFKNMNEAVTSYNQLVSLVNEAAAGKGFSDIAILTKFMKSLDPRSVVRDTEFQTAANTGSVLQSLENKIKGLVTGQKINDKQRQEILVAATAVMEANKENFGNFRKAQIAKAKQPLEYYKSIFPELDTESERLFVDIGESIKSPDKKQTPKIQTYKTPQGNKTIDEMRNIFYNAPQNKGRGEDAFNAWLINYAGG